MTDVTIGVDVSKDTLDACRLAARFNPDMKAKYAQLIEAGKPAKVTITAIMRKLIILANALLKKGMTWENKSACA